MSRLSAWSRGLVFALMAMLCVSHATMSEAVSHHPQAQTIGDSLSHEVQDELHSAHYGDDSSPGDAPLFHVHIHADQTPVAPTLIAPLLMPAMSPVMELVAVLTSRSLPPLTEPPAA